MIGRFDLTNNTATTKTLTDNLSNYRSLLITQSVITDGHSTVNQSPYGMYILAPVSYFSSQTSGITGYFCSGNSGSGNFQSTTCTYVSDTQIKFKQAGGISRTYFVYGIK